MPGAEQSIRHLSSYGTNTGTTDYSEQLAPADNEGPDIDALTQAFEMCVADNQGFVDQCQVNYDTRFALWPGKTDDGKKHAREGAKIDPTPWDGASDLSVFLVDEAINNKVALYRMAFKKANLVAYPVDGGDLKRAKLVSNFMRWLIQTQMKDVDREIELLANYINEKGVAVSGQFWEKCQDKTLITLRATDLQGQLPPGTDVAAIFEDPALADNLAATFEEQFGCSKGKAKRMVRELGSKGKTSVPVLGRAYSRPVMRAFSLDEEVFIPPSTTDIETASAIFRIEYFTPEQLRSFVMNEEWDADWVEKAIKTCRNKLIAVADQPYAHLLRRSRVFLKQFKENDRIGVVFAYQRLSDEDGVSGIYLTIFNPSLPPDSEQDGFAKFGLMDYGHGQYPFTLFRREYLSRRLHDTRGLPEPGKPWQDQIKAHKDSRIDAASIGVLPPLMFPMGRPPARIGPGAFLPERRTGEYHFMDRPMPDMNNENSEMLLRDDFRQYCGFASKEGDPQFLNLKNQNEVDKFLTQLCKSFRQIYALYKQFGDEKVFFRVMGLQQVDPAMFDKGDPNEQYDFYLGWDVQNTDPDLTQSKLDTIAKIIATGDKYGQVDYAEWLQVMLEAVDPAIAERIVRPQAAGTEQAVKEEKDALTKIYSGFDEDIKLGAPPQIGLQVMQQWAQSPDVMQRIQGDEALRSRVEKRAKQYQFQLTQQHNAQIGRLGA